MIKLKKTKINKNGGSKKKNNKKKTNKKIKTNKILKEYYEWEGQNIWYSLNKKKYDINRIFNRITNNYNKRNQDVEMIKTDTGIIVIILKNIVIKIYKKEKYERIKEIFDIKHPNIENTIDKIQFQDIFFVISEKIIPILIDFKINPILKKDEILKKNIINDIDNALNEIDENGYIHGDARLDNIGIKIKDNNYTYVIFDFGATTQKNETLRSTENDKKDFKRSVNIYLK